MKIMGSLPNLNELSTDFGDADVCNELFVKYIKDKGLPIGTRKQDHHPIIQTRSLGLNPNACITNVSLLKKGTFDKSDLFSSRRFRSARSSSVIPCHLHSVTISSNTQNCKHISRQASVTSSTGTSSVRKLIDVVRSTPSHEGPVFSRALICQNFVALCLSHSMFTVAFVFIIILQGSITVWWESRDECYAPNSQGSSNIGSILLAGLYFTAAVSAPISPFVAHKIGVTKCLALSYAISVMFVGVHLYPRSYLMIPAYILMGLSTGNLSSSKITYLMMLASKLKFVLSEEEEFEFQCKLDSTKRVSLVQKLFRGLSFSRNLSFIVGGIVTYFLIQMTVTTQKNNQELNVQNAKDAERICGYESCPRSFFTFYDVSNKSITSTTKNNLILPCKTSTILAGVFFGCCVACTLMTILFIHRIRIDYTHGPSQKAKFGKKIETLSETFKNSNLKFVTPLLIFIGISQGFMFADFTKMYVICVMGIPNAPLIFISLGLLQSIAGFTLSLLMYHVRRYFIIGVGFVFQACLLFVLILWKPTIDDAALFYVISAAWGVCNAIWDTLTFSLLCCTVLGLLVSLFPDNWEFPFSHNFFFRYLGLAIAFAYHGFICTSVKLYIMCGMLLMAVFPYAWLEIKLDSVANSKRNLVPKWNH